MRVLVVSLFVCLSALVYCNDESEISKQEVKPLSEKTINISGKFTRVVSSIAFDWYDSTGNKHNMEAGDYLIDNKDMRGQLKITDSVSVVVEPCDTYYEKKNDKFFKINKENGSTFNVSDIVINIGVPAYIELKQPALVTLYAPSTYLRVEIYYGNSLLKDVIKSKVNDYESVLLPAGKYRVSNYDDATSHLYIYSVTGDSVLSIYTSTTVSPGW